MWLTQTSSGNSGSSTARLSMSVFEPKTNCGPQNISRVINYVALQKKKFRSFPTHITAKFVVLIHRSAGERVKSKSCFLGGIKCLYALLTKLTKAYKKAGYRPLAKFFSVFLLEPRQSQGQ